MAHNTATSSPSTSTVIQNNDATIRTGGDTTTTTTRTTCPTCNASSSSSPPSTTNRTSTITQQQLEVLNCLRQPIWIYDFIQERNRWTNKAGLSFWNSPNLEEYCSRDRKQNRSSSTYEKLLQIQKQIENNESESLYWTLYPNGKTATTLHITVTGIQLHDDDNDHDGHLCMLMHGVIQDTETLAAQSLRGVEMLRHLPMAVCQFDMTGKVMFQNQWAQMVQPQQQHPTDTTTTTSEEEKNEGGDENDEDDSSFDKNSSLDDITSSSSSSCTATTSSSSSNSNNNETPGVSAANEPSKNEDEPENDNSMDKDSSSDDTTTATSCTTSSSSNSDNNNEAAAAAAASAANKPQKTNGSSSNGSSGDFMERFVNPKAAQEALTAIQNTTEEVIQFEAELYSTKTTTTKTTHHQSSSSLVPLSLWSEVTSRKTTDPITGKLVILYSAQDKSDAKNAIQERQASIQKSEFLAIMAHEIRTPLHQVIGFIDLLEQTDAIEHNLTQEQKSYISLLQSSAEGLMTVISDVLDYSKLEAGEMKIESIVYEPYNVVQGSIAAMESSCKHKQLTLSLDYNYKNTATPNATTTIPYRVLGDPNRLRQILLNLLSNAIKFTKIGSIQVKVGLLDMENNANNNDDHHLVRQLLKEQQQQRQQQDEDDGDVASSNRIHPSTKTTQTNSSQRQEEETKKKKNTSPSLPRYYIKFEIVDTGMGIGEEHQKLIFQKYHQGNLSTARNFGGSGLGLTICQLLVQSMGGIIGVDSQLGKGSNFWFLLPVRLPLSEQMTTTTTTNMVIPTPTTKTMTKRKEKSSSSSMMTTTTTIVDGTTSTVGNTNPSKDDNTSGPMDGSSSSLNILVAEDNLVNQKLISNMLKRLGHQSTIVENGQIAIDKIVQDTNSNVGDCGDGESCAGKRGGGGGVFDVVLMDIQMPVMDGLEATRRLRAMGYKDLPIIGLTASVKQHDYRELGFDDWLAKPANLKLLRQKLSCIV